MCSYDDFHIHQDLLGQEDCELDLNVMAVFGAMAKGFNKKDALNKYKISEEDYDSNIDRVLNH